MHGFHTFFLSLGGSLGNFTHVVYIRVSNNKNIDISIDEDRTTSALEEHNNYVVLVSQIKSVHPKESVSILIRFTAHLM